MSCCGCGGKKICEGSKKSSLLWKLQWLYRKEILQRIEKEKRILYGAED